MKVRISIDFCSGFFLEFVECSAVFEFIQHWEKHYTCMLIFVGLSQNLRTDNEIIHCQINFREVCFSLLFRFFRILSGKYVFRRPASDRVSCIHWPQAISRLIWKSAREYSCEFWNPKQNQHTKSMNFLSIWKITCTYDETILASLRNWTSKHKNCDRIEFACLAHSTYGFRIH